MGQVVRLADRRKRDTAVQQSAAPLATHAYFCLRCDTDRFLLYPGGAVQCANCGAQLDNLQVAEKPL
jgi:DNA-directed RNA polymerase subunit RPC12/RpoP